jgi:hypothetical protein
MTTSIRSHRCHRCNKRLSTWLYSQWTRERYCTDLEACAKRARRKTKGA